MNIGSAIFNKLLWFQYWKIYLIYKNLGINDANLDHYAMLMQKQQDLKAHIGLPLVKDFHAMPTPRFAFKLDNIENYERSIKSQNKEGNQSRNNLFCADGNNRIQYSRVSDITLGRFNKIFSSIFSLIANL